MFTASVNCLGRWLNCCGPGPDDSRQYLYRHRLHCCQIEIIDGIIRVDMAFIRKIVRERFDFGTPKYLTESDKEPETVNQTKKPKIKNKS
jgi:hypothetical protein